MVYEEFLLLVKQPIHMRYGAEKKLSKQLLRSSEKVVAGGASSST